MFGLGLDAVGAILIVFPFLNLFIVRRDPETRKIISRETRTAPVRRVQWYAWWGVAFLVAGFIFQGFGVMLQSQEINSMMRGS